MNIGEKLLSVVNSIANCLKHHDERIDALEENVISVDDSLELYSTNPVQNKVVAEQIANLAMDLSITQGGVGAANELAEEAKDTAIEAESKASRAIDVAERVDGYMGGTLQTELENTVKKTDYATASVAGLVKSSPTYGFYIGGGGVLMIYPASTENINDKKDAYKPIVSTNLDYAVKVGLTTNTEVLTDEEKAAAQAWLGINLGDVESSLDSIIAIQNSLMRITFTVNGTEYQAEQGMTWSEFIASEYNPTSTTGCGYHFFENTSGNNVLHFGTNSSPNGAVAYEGVYVTLSDTIISDRAYTV